MPLSDKIVIALGIGAVLIAVALATWGWAVSGGAKKTPITRDLDRHQDPDNYA